LKSLFLSLALGALTTTAIDINTHIDNEKFLTELSKGNIYVTNFNKKQYTSRKNDLYNQVELYNKNKNKPLTYQSLQVYLKIVSYEAGKDGGWMLENVNNDIFLSLLNEN